LCEDLPPPYCATGKKVLANSKYNDYVGKDKVVDFGLKSIEFENEIYGLLSEYVYHVPVNLTEGKRIYQNKLKTLLEIDKRFDGLGINQVIWDGEDKNGKYVELKSEVEKMSKSKYNVVNPDDIVADYGADSLRLYEMFLGPLEQYKPWNTAGITGVHNFLKKLWKLYVGDTGLKVDATAPTKDHLKTLHKTIKKVQADIENFSFNTSVSTFMIAVNELTQQKCSSKAVLEPLLILISPYAPHIAEELWGQLGYRESISTVAFPEFDESHLVESSKNYPISFNGKMRFTMELGLDLSKDEIEKAVLAHEKTQEQLGGRTPKKVIVVPGKIVNIVG
jgi:leucyl-tRNA synthetase